MFGLVYLVLSPLLLQLENFNFYLSSLQLSAVNTSLAASTENNQVGKRSSSPKADTQLLDSSQNRKHNFLSKDPQAIAFFSKLCRNQDFLNSGNVLAWALQQDDPDFFRIHKYVERTQGWQSGIKVLNILRVRPHPQSATSVDFKDDPDATGKLRMMLWHGTKTENLRSILGNGLKLELPCDDRFGSFGRGIYFSDRVWKAALFTDHDQVVGKQGYLILCEVLLGNIFKSERKLPHLTWPPQPQHYQSVQGVGKWYPDPEWNESKDGCVWPLGHIKDNKNLASWNNRVANEFIVYDTAQVQPKYLIKFEFTDGKFYH